MEYKVFLDCHEYTAGEALHQASPALSPQISRHLHCYPADIPHTGSEESRTPSTLSDALEADHFCARGTHQERLPIVWSLPVVWGGSVFFAA